MRQVKNKQTKKKQGLERPPLAAASRTHGQRGGKTALPRKDAAPSPLQAAPETPRARRKRPGLNAAAATTPAPAHKGRPPPRAQPGPPRLPPPSSPRAAPPGSNSRGRTHGGGVALRGTPGPLASSPASARLPGWAVTAFRPRPPRPGPLLRPFGRLPGARGRTPPSSGSPRPFPLPHRKAKTIGAAQAREGNGKQEGRRRREVTLASGPGLPGRPPGCQGACAERGRRAAPLPGLRRGLGRAVPKSSLQRPREFCAVAVVSSRGVSGRYRYLQAWSGVGTNGTKQHNTPGS